MRNHHRRANEIFDTVHAVTRHLHRRTLFGDMTKAEFFILHMISHRGHECRDGITVTNIAHKLNATMAATSKMLRSVEEKGYVERTLDDSDRRVVYIGITEKGADVIANAKNLMDDRVDRIIEKVGEEDAAEFLRILRKIASILQEEE